jgi:hypothetical protein
MSTEDQQRTEINPIPRGPRASSLAARQGTLPDGTTGRHTVLLRFREPEALG